MQTYIVSVCDYHLNSHILLIKANSPDNAVMKAILDLHETQEEKESWNDIFANTTTLDLLLKTLEANSIYCCVKEVGVVKRFTLNEKEIKEAIRKYLIDKLGTEIEIKEQNIELNALVSIEDNPYDFTATLTVKTYGVQS